MANEVVKLDCTMACLCCDVPVLLSSTELVKLQVPIAMCQLCFFIFQMSWTFRRMTRLIYTMRSQIASLYDWKAEVERNFRKVFSGMEDFEQALQGES
jgi:hypothetical protein